MLRAVRRTDLGAKSSPVMIRVTWPLGFTSLCLRFLFCKMGVRSLHLREFNG